MSVPTKSEVRHLAANKLAVLSGNAQLIANDPRCHPILKSKAELIDREARRLLDDLLALFTDADGHLGSSGSE